MNVAFRNSDTKQDQRFKTVHRIQPVSDDYGMPLRRLSLSNNIQFHMQKRRLSLPTKKATIHPIDPQLKKNIEELKYIVSTRKQSVHHSIQSNITYFPKYDGVGQYMHKNRNHDIHQALFVLQNVAEQSYIFPIQNGNGHSYAKDYIKVSLDYKSYEPYRANNPVNQIRCILCAKLVQKRMERFNLHSHNTISKVFFPCEHLCVCDTCYILQRSWSVCPLCDSDVKLVVHLSGNEKEEYLDWVEEIKPQLPSGFIQEFTKKSRQAIVEAMKKSIEGHIRVHENKEQIDQENETMDDEFEEVEKLKDKFCNIL